MPFEKEFGTFPQGGQSFCEWVASLFDFRWPIFLRASNDPLYVAVINSLAEKDLQIAELRKEIDKLHHIIRSARFAPKSERLQSKEDTTAQPSLFGNIELPAAAKPQPIEAEIEVPAHKRRARKRYTDKDGNPSHFPEHLERRDTELSTEDSLVCCDCGADKHEVAQVVSEKLQVIPAQYFVERMIKKVLICKHCEHKAPVKAASPNS